MCEPMGRREIFLTFSLLVEIEGHLTNEFVSYVYETEGCKATWKSQFVICFSLYIYIFNPRYLKTLPQHLKFILKY
jgi:hypothetical protein